jgi:hypothetical protein
MSCGFGGLCGIDANWTRRNGRTMGETSLISVEIGLAVPIARAVPLAAWRRLLQARDFLVRLK